MPKNFPRPARHEQIKIAEMLTQIARSQLSGQQTQTKFINPSNVKSKVQREVNSVAVKVDVFSFRISTIKVLTNIKSEQGIDFFRTCGMKFPRISSLFGWNVKMNEGTPITNISRSKSCFGVNGYDILKISVVIQSMIVKSVFIKY